jgi:spermidine synthase
MMTHPNPEKVLILGGGEGATLREVLRSKTVKKVVMVDIDKRLVEICKEFLPEYSCGAFEDPRAEVVITDALHWLENSNEKFDVIVGDLTDPWPQAPSHGIYSVPFFKLITARLNEGGLFVTQSSRITFADMYLHNVLFETMSKVFPILRTELVYIPGFDMPWSYTIASYTTDPLKISKEEIDLRISERIGDCLRFYDGEMHHSIFAIPKYIKEKRKQFLESPESRQEPESVFII